METKPKGRRAADTILLAALECGPGEFTLADLVLACWKLDPERFGLKGHEGQHPSDHRVAAEVCGVTPRHPIKAGLMERVRANVYRLTPHGIGAVDALKGGTAATLFRKMDDYLSWPIFHRWHNDPDQPKTLEKCYSLATFEADVKAAMKWCDDRRLDRLSDGMGVPIHYNRMVELLSFLDVLRMRFPKETKGAA